MSWLIEGEGMAEIRFTAFVEKKLGSWGMTTAEPHSKKNDQDEWVTVSRTFRTVKPAYGVELDLSQFGEGDRVSVVGRESTEISEKDGKKYYNLTVKAESVTLEAKGSPQADSWGGPGADAPF